MHLMEARRMLMVFTRQKNTLSGKPPCATKPTRKHFMLESDGAKDTRRLRRMHSRCKLDAAIFDRTKMAVNAAGQL